MSTSRLPRVYRIKTEVTEHGGRLQPGTVVKETARRTGSSTSVLMEERVDYSSSNLDRSVVNPDQIRKVLQAYKKSIYEELYPDREKKMGIHPEKR